MRHAGLSIEALIEYVTMFQKGDETILARKELLIEQRGQLAERITQMQETLSYLDQKVERYEETHLKYEAKLK